MDVQSLYPNIDHKEGTNTCKALLNKRNNRAFPTNQLTKLIQLILESNTMFNGRYFHQINETAMATSLAVSYANIFMSMSESNMLLEYQKKYNCEPTSWLRFIDIFFIWTGDEKSLKHFFNFCNNYSKRCNGMQSTMKFTYSYSTLTVNFLDVTVKVEKKGTLATTRFANPTASYQHLRAKSSHPFHTVKALLKSQFIKIRKICTFTSDYWKHAIIS